MDVPLFSKAFAIGLAVAAPVGPMSLLCMRTTLTHGWRRGLAVGGGIAAGDAAFAAVAALGLASVSSFMLANERPLHLAAGLFLIWLGLRSIFAKRSDEAALTDANGGAIREFASAALLTLTNPPTIIMFAAVFTALAPREGMSASSAATTVAGVLAGSMLWWCLVVLFASGLHHAIGARARAVIDQVSGVVLVALGATEINRGLAASR